MTNPEINEDERVPWKDGPLAQWSIVGMNHYCIGEKKYLYVAMTYRGQCIVENGKDDKYLWNRLYHKAIAADTALSILANLTGNPEKAVSA